MFNYVILRLKRLPGTPEFIAKGFAIGVAINFWPVLFTHLICGYILCRVLGGSLLAMFIGTLLGNPWTFAIVYPLMYKLGKVLLGLRPTHNPATIDSASEIWEKIWPIHSWESLWFGFKGIIFPMMIGGFLLALPCAILSYYVCRNAIRLYQIQHQKRLRKNFMQLEREIEGDHSKNP